MKAAHLSMSGMPQAMYGGDKMNARRKWFLERVGERVFRTDNGCGCDSCGVNYRVGIVIFDTHHANYLAEMESDPDRDLRYFDSIEERDKYKLEQSQK